MSSNGVTRINVWSGPRSRSTTLMYAFANRPDCTCLDEPLYAYHLSKNPHLERPYKDALMAAQSSDGNAVVANQILGASPTPLLVAKHMAKQAEGLDMAWASGCKHVILIRDPVKLVSSWAGPTSPDGLDMSLEEIGLASLVSLASTLRRVAGSENVVVVDADDLAASPSTTLGALCGVLGIQYLESMLSWDAGPKPCDGLWASSWYSTAHQSTGWYPTSQFKTFPASCFGLLEEALPFYNVLHRQKLSPQPVSTSQVSQGTAAAAAVEVAPAAAEAVAATSNNKLLATFSVTSERPMVVESDKAAMQATEAAMMPDQRNAKTLLVWVGAPGQGRLLPRSQAAVSVFDSAVQGGDAAWEGLRVYDGRIFHFEHHLNRLFSSARALDFKNVHSKEEIEKAVFSTLAANGMRDGCHIRLTLSRGRKTTSSMNPAFNVFGCTLIVLAEWKPVVSVATYDNTKGVSLITASQRRNPPSCLDSKIHHNNLLNNIIPKIQANLAGAADAIMLDMEGFVAETNACNLFMVDSSVSSSSSSHGSGGGSFITVATPTADACLPGITRAAVMDLVRNNSGSGKDVLRLEERRVSLAEFCAADEVFTTGTMGELTPVVRIDGRPIGDGVPGPVTSRLSAAYKCLIDDPALFTPLPDF